MTNWGLVLNLIYFVHIRCLYSGSTQMMKCISGSDWKKILEKQSFLQTVIKTNRKNGNVELFNILLQRIPILELVIPFYTSTNWSNRIKNGYIFWRSSDDVRFLFLLLFSSFIWSIMKLQEVGYSFVLWILENLLRIDWLKQGLINKILLVIFKETFCFILSEILSWVIIAHSLV